MADTTPVSEIRNMVNGDSNHYRVTDRWNTGYGRYFSIRGNADLEFTFRKLIKTATTYKVKECTTNGNQFYAVIVKE